MKNYILKIVFLMQFLYLCNLASYQTVIAQNGSGSINLHSELVIANGTEQNEFAETVYLGPGTFTINGVWNVYSKFIWIDPLANIVGIGSISFQNPASNLYYVGIQGATTLDHNNGVPIRIDVKHLNPSNLILGDISNPAIFPMTNPSGAQAAGLNIGKKLDLLVNGGDVMLNGHDLTIADTAAITNYGLNRMIVTGNSIAGHLVKKNTTVNTFVFPIGIAEGDYTPATITGSNNYHVSMVDYTAGPSANTVVGIDRTWHIYGGAASSIFLQHNAVTQGASYNDPLAFITYNLTATTWSIGTLGVDYVAPQILTSSIIAANIPVSASANSAFLSKTSDAINSLPIILADFNVEQEGCFNLVEWSTFAEINNAYFEIYRSDDGINWEKIHKEQGIGNSNQLTRYRFVDNSFFKKGTYYYYLNQVDFNGRSETFPIKSVAVKSCVGAISLFPNPTSDAVNIKWDHEQTEITAFRLIDIVGKVLMINNQVDNSGAIIIDVGHYSEGTYTVILMNETEVVSNAKFVLIK